MVLDIRTYKHECRRAEVDRRREAIRRSAWDRWRKTVVIPVLILVLGARTPVALADLIRIVAGG